MSSSRSGVVTVGASRKRKEREAGFDAFRKSSTSASTASAHNKAVAGAGAGAEPNLFGLAASGSADNRLLAGYLAHEFLTKGTLLGQKWDPARAEAAPVTSRTLKAQLGAAAKVVAVSGGGGGGGGVVPAEIYADVANLLKSGGTQVPGIVNPTQLARWLQM